MTKKKPVHYFQIADYTTSAKGRIACPECGQLANIAHYYYVTREEKFRVYYACWKGSHFGSTLVGYNQMPKDRARDYQEVDLVHIYDKHL